MQFWSDAFGCQSVFQFVTCSGCFLQRLPSFLWQTKWSKVLTCVMSRMRWRRKKANCLKSTGRFVYSHSSPRASCLYDFLSVSSASLLSVALSFSHICVAVSHVSQPSSSSSPCTVPPGRLLRRDGSRSRCNLIRQLSERDETERAGGGSCVAAKPSWPSRKYSQSKQCRFPPLSIQKMATSVCHRFGPVARNILTDMMAGLLIVIDP